MDLVIKNLYFTISLLCIPSLIEAHGRLIEPPARNTIWRFGFKAQTNYNDNELFCGGIGGITRNRGKCGVCGDPFDGPRLHETGNPLAQNETVRNYFPGSSIDIMIEIVANHGGSFLFEMCWRDSWNQTETEECFETLELSQRTSSEEMSSAKIQDDRNTTEVLEIGTNDGSARLTSYELDPARGTGIFTMSVDLPRDKTCDRCILRWHWRSANNWGVCEDGSEAIGCGYQEVYRNCADISVKRNGAGIGLGANRKR